MRARFVLALSLILAPAAHAEDAPYVTTPQNVIDAMLDIAGVSAEDFLIDLGSGDGRIVVTAAKQRGARGMGVELDANLVHTARLAAQRAGVQARVSFVSDDLFFADLDKATVITIYMSEAVNQRLRPRLFKLRPGTRVVSHDFDMGRWMPDAKRTVPVPDKPYGAPRSDIMMWIVPANFSGSWSWRLPHGAAAQDVQVTFIQKFQRLEAKAGESGGQAAIERPEVRGDAIRFAVSFNAAGRRVHQRYEGRLSGDTISGTAVTIGGPDETITSGVPLPWRATRIRRGVIDIDAGAQPFASGNFNKE